MSLFQQPVPPQKGDTSSLEHLIKTIKLLTNESDVEKFNKIASDLQAVIHDELNTLEKMQDLLGPIKEELKKVCAGSHTSKAVGQAKITCCSYISLMFVHLI